MIFIQPIKNQVHLAKIVVKTTSLFVCSLFVCLHSSSSWFARNPSFPTSPLSLVIPVAFNRHSHLVCTMKKCLKHFSKDDETENITIIIFEYFTIINNMICFRLDFSLAGNTWLNSSGIFEKKIIITSTSGSTKTFICHT